MNLKFKFYFIVVKFISLVYWFLRSSLFSVSIFVILVFAIKYLRAFF